GSDRGLISTWAEGQIECNDQGEHSDEDVDHGNFFVADAPHQPQAVEEQYGTHPKQQHSYKHDTHLPHSAGPRDAERAAGAAAPPQIVPQAAFDTSEPAATLRVGPAAVGRMSNSKMSVGMASVQQALGISTMPLTRPSTGAVPSRI